MVKVHKALMAAKAEIDHAIVSAEQGTSGELVVVATPKAGNYSHVEANFAFTTSLVAFAAAWIWRQRVTVADWTLATKLSMGVWESCLVLIVGFLLGLLIVKVFPRIGPALSSKRFIEAEIERSAALEFRRFNVARTKSATGVLIFLAEAERRVVVLGDVTIAKEVSDAEWEEVRDIIIADIRNARPVKGLTEGIARAGELLKKHFPGSDEAGDELPSEIHL